MPPQDSSFGFRLAQFRAFRDQELGGDGALSCEEHCGAVVGEQEDIHE